MITTKEIDIWPDAAVNEFPESMRAYTTPVHHAIYRIYRTTWAERQGRRLAGQNQRV